VSDDWYDTETLSNPDGSMDVHFCHGCGMMLATKTVEDTDTCPSCGHPEDGGDE
jgi:rubrerythrin